MVAGSMDGKSVATLYAHRVLSQTRLVHPPIDKGEQPLQSEDRCNRHCREDYYHGIISFGNERQRQPEETRNNVLYGGQRERLSELWEDHDVNQEHY